MALILILSYALFDIQNSFSGGINAQSEHSTVTYVNVVIPLLITSALM